MQWHFINQHDEHYITQGGMTAQNISSDLFQFLSKEPVFITEDKQEIHIYIDDPALSDWIKTVRKYRKWTQQQLSEYSEVSVQYISQIERKFIVANQKTYAPIIATLLDSGSETIIHYHKDPIPTVKHTGDSTNLEVALLKTEIQDILERLYDTDDFYVLSTTQKVLSDISRVYRALSLPSSDPNGIDTMIDIAARNCQQGLHVVKAHYNEKK